MPDAEKLIKKDGAQRLTGIQRVSHCFYEVYDTSSVEGAP